MQSFNHLTIYFKKSFLLLLPCLLVTFFLLLSAPSVYAQTPTPTVGGTSPADFWRYERATRNEPYIMTPEKLGEAGRNQGGSASYDLFGGYLIPSTLMSSTILAVAGEPTTQQVLGPNGQPITQNGQPVYETVYKGGAIEIVGNLTASLYTNKPASSVEYLADLGSNLGILPVKTAYAQGLGFSALSPVLVIWKAFRNIAYLAFIIIFVIIGFMIMFRKKIDPRTVVTVQDSIPRIIVALILITFSYAIAGFIIDLGQLSTYLIGETLKREGFLMATYSEESEKQLHMQKLYQANIFELINPLRDVDKLTKDLTEAAIPGISELARIPVLSSLTIRLVFWVAGLFIMFKIFFALIGPYVGIILSVVFAPFQLLLAALPGGNSSVSNWLKTLLSNILVFPVTFGLLAIAAVLKGYTKTAYFGQSADWGVKEGTYTILWSPATIGYWGDVVGDLVAFGILFTIPKVIQIVHEALQYKPSPWLSAPGEELKMATGKIPFIGGAISKQM